MPKINVYLPDDLAEAVKEAGLPVSPICQQALEQAVRRVAELRAGLRLEVDIAEPAQRMGFTERARAAVTLATERAVARQAERVGTADVLAGILDEGGNLAIRVLRALEVDFDTLRARLDAPTAEEGSGGKEGSTVKEGRAAEEALNLAVNDVISLGHNYVGCEHLLLGLIAEPNGVAGAALRSLGAEHRVVRRAVTAALDGFVHARAQAQPPDAIREMLAPVLERLSRLEARVGELAARA